MKKTAFFLTAIVTLMMLASCKASRTPINAEDFKTKAEAAEYTVQDALDQFPAGVANDYLIAFKGTTAIDYQIEFADVPTVEQAVSAYQENRSKFEEQKGSSSVQSSVSAGNYSYYKLASNGRYYVISRIENTFIYIDASVEYKDEIVEFLRNIGY